MLGGDGEGGDQSSQEATETVNEFPVSAFNDVVNNDGLQQSTDEHFMGRH